MTVVSLTATEGRCHRRVVVVSLRQIGGFNGLSQMDRLAASSIALAGAGYAAQPAAADEGVVCTTGGDCWSNEDPGPWFCYWGAYGYLDDGTLVVFVDWNSDPDDPPASDDAFLYCESGF